MDLGKVKRYSRSLCSGKYINARKREAQMERVQDKHQDLKKGSGRTILGGRENRGTGEIGIFR